MKFIHQLLSFVALAVAVRITYATINSSVTVHFVPPLVAGNCIFGRWWNPQNVTCATCFCMTGTLSRCFPTPGCNPNPGNPQEHVTPGHDHDNSTPPPAAMTNPSPPATSANVPPSPEASTQAPVTTPPGTSHTPSVTSTSPPATTPTAAATTAAAASTSAAFKFAHDNYVSYKLISEMY